MEHEILRASESTAKMADREDWISALPDHLLHHIFSFLELKEIIATSLLSTRWRYIWTSVPTLDLGSWPYETNHDIPTQISLSLMNYASPKIRKFRAHFDFADIKHWHVYSWIRFAAERDVQEFDLSLMEDSGWKDRDSEGLSTLTFKVLDCLLKCSSLEVLKLSFCQLNLRSSSCNLCLLRELELCYVWLSDVDTSGCPVLESLILVKCNSDEPLNIYVPSPKLRYLRINDFDQLGRVTLFAPNLQSIEFDGYIREAYNVKNLSSLRIASFELEGPGVEYLQPLMELLRGVLHASTLRLDHGFMECLSFLEAGVKLPPFRTTCLELKTALEKSDLRGMALVLSSATSLETLILDTSSIKVYLERQHLADLNLDDLWGSLGQSLFSIRSLKNIEIKNFLGSGSKWLCKGPGTNFNNEDLVKKWEKEFKLVKTLLSSCTMLEKMSISPIKISTWSLEPELLLDITKKLLTFRASANAEIYFL